MEEEAGGSLRRISLPIAGMGIPDAVRTMQTILRHIRESTAHAPAVYVHCWGASVGPARSSVVGSGNVVMMRSPRWHTSSTCIPATCERFSTIPNHPRPQRRKTRSSGGNLAVTVRNPIPIIYRHEDRGRRCFPPLLPNKREIWTNVRPRPTAWAENKKAVRLIIT